MDDYYKRKYAEVLDEKTNVDAENKELRKLLKEAQKDCRVAQESLDNCERDIMEMRGL